MQQTTLKPSIQSWINNQLQGSGDILVRVMPLRVEASNRLFYRLLTRRETLVLMVSPPDLERNDAFCAIADLFQAAHIPVPVILARQMQQGWFLLEDLGEQHLEQAYATAAKDQTISLAVELLVDVAAIRSPLIEAYSEARMDMEVHLFNEWFVHQLLALDDNASVYQHSYRLLLEAMLMQPQGCVHRDYHCRNLLFQADKTPPQLGVVDFQDALHGPLLYDPASLLRDCYYVFSEAEITHWLDHFISVQPLLQTYERAQIQTWFDFTAIQRQLKAIGIFARLHLRDQKSSHLTYIPPLLRRLCDLCAGYPQLHELQVQLESCKNAVHDPRLRSLFAPSVAS